MMYSEVINNNLHEIIGNKNKYTNRYIKQLINKGYTEKQSIFILKCTAIYYDKF